MRALKYITRGGTAPNGKRRVYFCAHGSDLSLYLEPISEEILRLQNCAIWYDGGEGEEISTETRELELSEMNLFIMPVTERLLTDKNDKALDEFRFAVSHHIPVLPLMQERGLEEEFNRVCGDLQFLDKSSDGRTGIGYDEKLERFLSSVLIGDELAEKIRAAFDAYIFLSYRKKDRAYAQKLMRLIHENEFCRDIAIWYDEFLTPGENFNDEIAGALDKSRLFALAVTPNLVNEKNYVMTVEYPMARRAGKRIFAAEVVPTDKKALRTSYDEIPETVDAYDKVGLSSALMRELEELAIKENDNTPEHNFFIGLAYLSGIDVEVDHERAVRLIEGAAERDLPEAVEKLIGMYRDGEGVARSYESALKWRIRLTSIKKDICDRSDDKRSANKYLYQQYYLAVAYEGLFRKNEAVSEYKVLISEAERLKDRIGKRDTDTFLSLAYEGIGMIQAGEGIQTEAEVAYKTAIAIREGTESLGASELSALADVLNSLGNLYKAYSRYSEAAEQYERALSIRERVSEMSPSIGAERMLAISYDNRGAVLEKLGEMDKALECYKKALPIFERSVEADPSVQNRRDLAICHEQTGSVYEDSDRGKASEHYSEACRIWQEIADETESFRDYSSLAGLYLTIGANEDKRGNGIAVESYYRIGISIYEDMMPSESGLTVSHNLAALYSRLGMLMKSRGELDECEKYLMRSLEIREKLDAEGSLSVVRSGISLVYYELGELYTQKGDLERAERMLTRALGLYSAMAEGGDIDAASGVAVVKGHLARIREKQEDFDGALALYKEAEVIQRERSERLNSLDAKRRYATAVENIASLQYNIDRNESTRLYAEVRKMYSQIAESSLSESDARSVLRIASWLGTVYEQAGRIDEAINEYIISNSARNEKDGTVYTLEPDAVLAARYTSLGRLYLSKNETESAIDAFRFAVSLLEGVDDLGQDAGKLPEALYGIGEVMVKKGDIDEAEEYYSAAIQKYLFACLKTRSLTDYYGLARVHYLSALIVDGRKKRKRLKRSMRILRPLVARFSGDIRLSSLYGAVLAELEKKK